MLPVALKPKTMIIVNETELMANQKASTTITPDVEFEALETSAGNSVLFSISSENVFYCTYEVPGDTHGWTRVDMSSVLATGNFQGKTIQAKSFDVGQDLSAGTIDLALVVTVNSQDYLYIAYNVADANMAGITAAWQQFPFDDQGSMQLAGKPINDVFVTRANGQMYVFADINTQDATNTLSRYAIDQSNTIMANILGYQQAWIPHGMSMDAQAGAITNAIGCGPDDAASGGIYTLCSIANLPQLQYAALFNGNDPGGPAFPVNFQLPAGTDATYKAMAVSASAQAPLTDLFFVTNTTINGKPTGALYFIPGNKQLVVNSQLPAFTQVYTHDLLYDIQSIHVNNWNDNIVLWGQSKYTDPTTGTVSSQLFVMEGVRGSETNAAAWSCPIPLLFGVENSTTYVNNAYSSHSSIDPTNGNAYGTCSVIFAHQADGSLVKLFQDPVTSAWQERFLLTEPLDANTVLYETTSYTSHVRITDDSNMVQPLIPVSIWASSPCSVYVNNTYSNLAFDTPLKTTADENGIVNIMQPVDTIGGLAFHLAVQDPNTKQWYTQTVNPFTATTANIKSQVPDGTNNHLSGNVYDEMNNPTPVAPNASADEQLATSKNIYSFYTNADQANLNADGLTTDQEQAGGWPNPATSVQAVIAAVATAGSAAKKPAGPIRVAKPERQARHMRFNAKTDKIWGCTFGKNAKHFEGIDEMKAMGLVLHDDGSMSLTMANGELGSFLGAIESKAGHLFKWMKSEAEKLEQAVIKLGEDGLDCLLTIAGTLYHFVVKCVNDVVNAIHTVLNAIKTAFADLVKWIGSIFAWHDFVATHSVIKNLFITYTSDAIDGISKLETKIQGCAAKAIGAIDQWAGVPDDSAQSQSADPSNNKDSGQHSPQSNWGHHHMKNNASNATLTLSSNDYSSPLQTLINAIQNEENILSDAADKLGAIFSNNSLQSMSVLDLLKQVAAVFADGILLSCENIMLAFLGLVADIIKGAVEEISDPKTAELKIPVLSTLYERFVGSPLTLLDLVCLLCAIPVTVVYKLANGGTAPFPAGDSDTIALSTAPDFATIAQLCMGPIAAQTAGLTANAALGGAFDPQLNNRWYRLFFAGNIMALVGGLAMSTIAGIKASSTPEVADSKIFGWLNAIFYLPYVGPDIVGNVPGIYYAQNDDLWYGDLNAACAGLGIIKAFWDIRYTGSPENNASAPPVEGGGFLKTGKTGYAAASPILDALLGLLWEVPVVFAYLNSNKNKNDIIDLVANTAFNITGPLSLLVNFAKGPVQFGAILASIGFNGVYGILSIAESLDGQPIDPIILY